MNNYDISIQRMCIKTKQLREIFVKAMSENFDDVTGVLRMKEERGSVRFYRKNSDDSNHEEYLGKNKLDLIKQLAQKRYNEEMLICSEKQLTALNKCKEILETADRYNVEKVYANIPEPIKPFVEPMFETNEGFCRHWEEQKCIRRKPDTNSPYFTQRHEQVRSESELIIADRLNFHKIPYIYEKTYTFEDFGKVIPAFTVLNRNSKQEFIWEHFVLTDNPKDTTSMIKKLAMYAEVGFVPGKNLITTFENSQSPLNAEYAECIIREYLLSDFRSA